MSILLKSCNDFELCEDSLQEALVEAVRSFPPSSSPNSLPAWLLTVARRKLIDKLRKGAKEVTGEARDRILETAESAAASLEASEIPDERLTLIFLCCHPSLPEEQRIALTLHSVCGLSTGAIAKGFITTESTMAQRITRAKRRIQETGIRFELPDDGRWSQRLESVMKVIYLIFSEGYRPTGGSLVRDDLLSEAVFLAKLVERLLRKSGQPLLKRELSQILGLLALMNFVAARSRARLDETGEMRLLPQQDRSLWDRNLITEGKNLLEKSLLLHEPGPYQLQAAIHLLHLEAASPELTDWGEISALYNALLSYTDTPLIRLNFAVAVSHVLGPAYALEVVAGLENDLRSSSIYYLTRADLEERLDRVSDALRDYETGYRLEQNAVIRSSVAAKMEKLNAVTDSLSNNTDRPTLPFVHKGI